MGEPATPSPADRLATRTLASAVLEAIRDDEAMPIGIRAFLHGGGLDQAYDKDDAESLIAQLCGEIVELMKERHEAVALLAKATHGGNITNADWKAISALLKVTGVEP